MNRHFFAAILIFTLLLAACAQSAAPESPGNTAPVTEIPAESTGESPDEADVTEEPPILDETPLMGEGAFAPKPEDKSLRKANASVESSDLLILESLPQQYRLQLSGTLPTPCHQLRVERVESDEPGIIAFEVYSVVDPDQICTQVLQPFDVTIPVEQVEPDQEYTVVVNDEPVAEIAP